MKKCPGSLFYFYISTLLFSLLFLQAFDLSPANANEDLLINGKHQMGLGDTKALSIMNYRTGPGYVWAIEEGGGSLSSNTGEKVEYVAPDSNPGCANNPIIGITDSYGNYGSIEISINSYQANTLAYKYGRQCGCAVYDPVSGHYSWGCGAKAYGCNGEYLGLTSPSAGAWGSNTVGMPPCPQWCDICGKEDEVVDVRSDELKDSGCCPEAVQPWYQPPPTIPSDVDHGKDPQANNPVCDPSLKGNPIRIYNGNNIEAEEDLRISSPNRRGFGFKRFYNSRSEVMGSIGYGWTRSYSAHLDPVYEYTGNIYLRIMDESGRGVYFRDQENGHYVGVFKEKTTVKLEGGNYVWYRLDNSRFVFSSVGRLTRIEDEIGNGQVLTYDGADRLQSVTDEASGRALTFSYDGNGLLNHVSGPMTSAVPSGIWVSYTYDEKQNLTSVVFADGSGIAYVYGDPNDAHNLTEKKDNMGHVQSTWAYDDEDRGIESVTRDGRGVTINYIDENEVEVTNAYGVTSTYGIWDVEGRKRVTDIGTPQGCPECGNDVVRLEYDTDLNVIEVEYANGLINQYDDFDDHGNARVVTKAVGTSDERTTTYTFHPSLKSKLSRTEDSLLGFGHKVTIWDYDNDGNNIPNEHPSTLLYRKIEKGLTKDITGQVIPYEYITSYTYNNKGQVLTIDGPDPGNQDTTVFTYDPVTGDILTLTRPVVGATTYSDYDAAGYVHRVQDPNGIIKTYTYNGRGRPATVTNEANSGTIDYDYNNAGDLAKLTTANGTRFDLVYDEAFGRLKRVTDSLGNYIYYNYDDQGNRTELSYFSSSDEHLYWKRFDNQGPTHPGRLWKILNPDNTYVEYSYDAGGNIHLIRDPSGKTTSYDYDILNRLIAVTQPGNTVTSYVYDSKDNLSALTDAEDHPTTYLHDDLGRLLVTTSPDTGTTAYTYDDSGNLISKKDANGNATFYTYDTLNRLTAIHFPDSAQDITYTYDQGPNGKGRLTGMATPAALTFTGTTHSA